MALWDTMMVEDHLKSSGKYCIRTKRLSGHHNNNNKYLQFQRRSSEATLADFDHHRSHHHRSHHHHWVFTSPSSTFSSSASFSSPSSTTSSGRFLLSNYRRTDRRASDRGPTSSSSLSSYSLMSPVPSPSTFQLGDSTRTQPSEVSSSLSLPPVVQRFDMVGSPFLPVSYQETFPSFDATSLCSQRHYAARGAGHHGIKALGRASGSGSGSSPLPSSSSVPVKMPMGPSDDVGDDVSDGEDASQAHMLQPSSYTFRRRNAIVEGSEDAPKPSEFSDSASGSE
ncbi:hypothetical protein CPB97_003931 [Podila verticillata]|nr:hypothetical protein CPB97_003931 [Podila verticillata]